MIGEWSKQWAQKTDWQTYYFLELESTNDFCKHKLCPQELKSLVLCEQQNKGRGRGTNTWVSPQPGSALLSSWLFPLEYTPQPILSPLIGLAVYNATQKFITDMHLSLKAPNDLYWKDKKIAGVLIEVIEQQKQTNLIVGLGMNIFAPVKEIPSSGNLQSAVDSPIDKETWQNYLDLLETELTKAVLKGQSKNLQDGDSQFLLEALNRNPNLKQKFTQVDKNANLYTETTMISWMEL